MPVKFLTVRNVADTLQLSTKSVYALVSSGELPSYRFRGAVRIAQTDFDAYMAERRSTGKQRASNGAARLKWLSV